MFMAADPNSPPPLLLLTRALWGATIKVLSSKLSRHNWSRLKGGVMAYYWQPHGRDRSDGFTLHSEPLEKGLFRRCDRAIKLNAHLDAWRKGEACQRAAMLLQGSTGGSRALRGQKPLRSYRSAAAAVDLLCKAVRKVDTAPTGSHEIRPLKATWALLVSH